jgi:hypothetical protein
LSQTINKFHDGFKRNCRDFFFLLTVFKKSSVNFLIPDAFQRSVIKNLILDGFKKPFRKEKNQQD